MSARINGHQSGSLSHIGFQAWNTKVLYSCAGNFLFLPGLVAWCPHVHHAYAVGPFNVFDVSRSRWGRGSIFETLYNKTFSLFYKWGSETFYAGTYKALNLKDIYPEGLQDKKVFEKGVVRIPVLAFEALVIMTTSLVRVCSCRCYVHW